MLYLLQKEESMDSLLETLSRAAFSVVSDNLPESRREDVLVGMYVALSHVLSERVSCGPGRGAPPEHAPILEAGPPEGPPPLDPSH